MFLKVLLAILAISCCLTASSAAVLNKFNYHEKADDTTKTPWELVEAIRAGSQIRGFNGTWITGEKTSILNFNNYLLYNVFMLFA